MKLSKREKVLIILVLIIMGVLGYVFLFLTPRLDETKKLDSQNKTNQATIQTNKVLKQKVEDTIKQLAENEKKLAEFGDNIKSAFDQPPVLVYLYETISNRNSDKIMISFEGSGELGQVKYFKVLVTMRAKYDDMKNIIKDFAESEYFIKVVSLSAEIKAKAISDNDSESDEADTTEPSFTDNFTETETAIDDKLEIRMDLEFYYIGTEIPPDKTYDFTDGAVQYGGDIFH